MWLVQYGYTFSFIDFPIFFSPEGSRNITEKSRNKKNIFISYCTLTHTITITYFLLIVIISYYSLLFLIIFFRVLVDAKCVIISSTKMYDLIGKVSNYVLDLVTTFCYSFSMENPRCEKKNGAEMSSFSTFGDSLRKDQISMKLSTNEIMEGFISVAFVYRPVAFTISIDVVEKVTHISVGPWSNGYQCGMRIPRPGSIPSVCQITDADLGQVG